jgi:hypothetical protein
MNWWQGLLLVLGIAAVSWLIPALIFGYAFGGVVGSIRHRLGKEVKS